MIRERPMTRTILATLALMLSSACAQGQNWGATAILPPAEFEHPYPGELTITRVPNEDTVRAICYWATFTTGRAMGCSIRTGMVRCQIYIAADEVLAIVGLDYETTLHHVISPH